MFLASFSEKKFYLLPFFPASLNLKNFAVIAGAKVHPFSASASFPGKFFDVFFVFYPNSLEGSFLDAEVFFDVFTEAETRHGFFTIIRHARTFESGLAAKVSAQYKSRRFQKCGGLL